MVCSSVTRLTFQESALLAIALYAIQDQLLIDVLMGRSGSKTRRTILANLFVIQGVDACGVALFRRHGES
ncbi:MAG: hypothetical protein ACLT98_05260 [Eggerthellaceae bacterium]